MFTRESKRYPKSPKISEDIQPYPNISEDIRGYPMGRTPRWLSILAAGLTHMLSMVIVQLECRRLARAPLQSSMVLSAAASTDGKKIVAVAGVMRN